MASYPKSGNTWLRVFLANYTSKGEQAVLPNEIESYSTMYGSEEFEEVTGLLPSELTTEEVELYRPNLYRYFALQHNEDDVPLFLKIHDAYTLNINKEPLFPEEVSRVAIYIVRNPLDVCVSYSSHIGLSIEEIIKIMCMEGSVMTSEKKLNDIRQILSSWSTHAKSWVENTSIPVHLLRYEDMIERPIESFGSIVRACGLEYNLNRVEWAVENSSFKKMQESERKNSFIIETFSGNPFFRKGCSGDYRDHLTADQIQRLVEYNYQMMRFFNYIDSSGNLTV